MSFTAINSTEIESGKPVSANTQTKIQENFDNHEDRITDLETGTSTVYPPIILRVNGPYADLSTAHRTGIIKTTTNFALQITGARLLIDTAGSTGTTQIDILKKSGGGAFASIFTTKPSVVYTAGNDALSSNTVLDATKVDLLAGDILRLDLTSVQAAAEGFLVRIDYERT
jgi:hypothetical protein